MNKFCFWYDELDVTYKRIKINDLVHIKESGNIRLFERIKSNLFYFRNSRVPMCAVINVPVYNRGFRCKGVKKVDNNRRMYRGAGETLTHAANKEAIANLERLNIIIAATKVTLYIDEVIPERSVVCNGRFYRVDLLIKIRATIPEHYLDILGSELYLELCHTCPVDTRQAEDFAVENLPLYEFKIPEKLNVYENITAEGYDKRLRYLVSHYLSSYIDGILIVGCRNYSNIVWRRKEETGNLVGYFAGQVITITRSKAHDGYAVCVNDLWHDSYNGCYFETEEAAIRNAQFIAFEQMNKSIKKDNYI